MSAWLTQVADHLIPNRICENLKTCEKVMGKRGVES
jgi:hypothetical protein